MKRRFSLSRHRHEQKHLLILLVAFVVYSTAARAKLNAQPPPDAMPRLVDYRMEIGSGCDLSGVHGCRRQAGTSCQCGRDVCCPTMEQVTEEVPCWNVTCEKVCVPAVRLPWEPGASKLTLFSWLAPKKHACSCGTCVDCIRGDVCCNTCAPKCGPVRRVSVLAPESYEVTRCRCKWEIRRLPACCPTDCLHCREAMSTTPETEPALETALPPPSPEL